MVSARKAQRADGGGERLLDIPTWNKRMKLSLGNDVFLYTGTCVYGAGVHPCVCTLLYGVLLAGLGGLQLGFLASWWVIVILCL